jgi:hypothetical protein
MVGLPGTGKDTVAEKLLQQFPGAVSISQDSYGKGFYPNPKTGSKGALVPLLKDGKTVFICRNNFSVWDRKKVVGLLRDNGYTIIAIVPSELQSLDENFAKLYLASVAGAACRLSLDASGKVTGHETLLPIDRKTRKADMSVLGKVTLAFALRYVEPTSKEVDAIVRVPFLSDNSPVAKEDLDSVLDYLTAEADKPKSFKNFAQVAPPPFLAELLATDSLEEAQKKLRVFQKFRRPLDEICSELSAILGAPIPLLPVSEAK